jgi:hypothetical protein
MRQLQVSGIRTMEQPLERVDDAGAILPLKSNQ